MKQKNKEETSSVFLHIEMDRERLLEAVADMDKDVLLQLIKDIDDRQADWDFTEALHDHFSTLHETYLKEKA
jgi:hypothetical protein